MLYQLFWFERNSWKVLLSGRGIKNHIFPIDIVGYFWYDKPMKQRNTKQREVADMNLVTSKRKFIHKDDRMCMCCCCCKENI